MVQLGLLALFRTCDDISILDKQNLMSRNDNGNKTATSTHLAPLNFSRQQSTMISNKQRHGAAQLDKHARCTAATKLGKRNIYLLRTNDRPRQLSAAAINNTAVPQQRQRKRRAANAPNNAYVERARKE